MLKITHKETKYILIGLGTLIFYLLADVFQAIPLYLLRIDISKMSTLAKSIYLIFYQLALIIIIAYVYKSYLKEKWMDLKKNHKPYFNNFFKYWILLLVLMLISNSVIRIFIPDSLPTNEESIREIFKVNPIYMYVSAVFIAPLLEELVFRLGFRYMFKTDIVFIILSGLMFGALHVLPSAEGLIELLYLIPYSIPGFIFAYVLTKTDNIFTTIGLHFIHNGVLMSLQFLIMLLA